MLNLLGIAGLPSSGRLEAGDTDNDIEMCGWT